MRAAEAREIARRELFAQKARAAFLIEVPDRPLAEVGDDVRFGLLWNEHFGGFESLDLARERFFASGFEHAEASARQLEPREAEAIAFRAQTREQRVAPRFQERFVGDGTRRDDPYDLPFDRAFRFRGIADLLADRDGFAPAHE